MEIATVARVSPDRVKLWISSHTYDVMDSGPYDVPGSCSADMIDYYHVFKEGCPDAYAVSASCQSLSETHFHFEPRPVFLARL